MKNAQGDGSEIHGHSTTEVISIQNLWLRYDGDPVLEDICLAVRPLDFVGIIGPNGGGKSTLLKVLLGILHPQRGNVRILGRSVREVRHRIGYVPQFIEFDRAFPIRVRDVVRMGRLAHSRVFHRYSTDDEAAVDAALRDVEILDLAEVPVGELSGGQRQRTLIARALAVEPSLLLLDEPTASVDTRVYGAIYELLGRLNERMTILMVTHDMGAISTRVKSVGCLNRRLHYHGERELSRHTLEETYQCPIDLIAHGVPHRVFSAHGENEEGGS